MWLNGDADRSGTMYSVTVNSFLASGGDGFLELNNGAGKQDTGKTDLQGMVDYMAEFGTAPTRSIPTTSRTGSTSPSRPPLRRATHRVTTWCFDVWAGR